MSLVMIPGQGDEKKNAEKQKSGSGDAATCEEWRERTPKASVWNMNQQVTSRILKEIEAFEIPP